MEAKPRLRLTKGKYTIVDSEDYEFLKRFELCVTNTGYAKTSENLYLHRLILGVGDPRRVVDHINGDTLDNRKHNLRVTNQSINMSNTNKSNGVSRFRGVYPHANGKWCAQFRHKHLGMFIEEEIAARAYIKAKNEYIASNT